MEADSKKNLQEIKLTSPIIYHLICYCIILAITYLPLSMLFMNKSQKPTASHSVFLELIQQEPPKSQLEKRWLVNRQSAALFKLYFYFVKEMCEHRCTDFNCLPTSRRTSLHCDRYAINTSCCSLSLSSIRVAKSVHAPKKYYLQSSRR